MSGSSRQALKNVIGDVERLLSRQKSRKVQALNAFISDAGERPQFDREIQETMERGDIDPEKSVMIGKMVAVKDNICTVNEPTTCASSILHGFQSPFPAAVVEQLEEAGAFVIGKTNMDEFGMGSHSLNSHFGPVGSSSFTYGDPLSAGGSSGGSAVAVATQQRFMALGTDTGGSVRLPAAYTGIVGFKPSYGIISRWGVVAYANSLDTVGLLAGNTSKIRHLFELISAGKFLGQSRAFKKERTRLPSISPSRAGSSDTVARHHPQDPTFVKRSTFDRKRGKEPVPHRIENWRIGVPREYNTEELDPSIRKVWQEALETLRALGLSIHPVSLPTTQIALSAYYVLAAAEASSNLAKYDSVRYGKPSATGQAGLASFAETRASRLGDEVRRRILLGSYTLSAGAIDNHFIKAQKVRRLVQRDFNEVFRLRNPLLDFQDVGMNEDGVDFLLTPTTPTFPPTLSSLSSKNSVDTFADDVMTVPASLAGLPAISVPVPISGYIKKAASRSDGGGLNCVGLQVIGQYGSDNSVIDMAGYLQHQILSARFLREQAKAAKSSINGQLNPIIPA